MPDFALEDGLGAAIVAGVDEVGRGPLAGPVYAAAVIFEDRRLPALLRDHLADSKKVTARRRTMLFEALPEHARIGIGSASVAEIDSLNILQASLLAMSRAVEALGVRPDHALVDGDKAPELPCPATAVVGGDDRSLSIAAASIVAKVTRDRIMAELAAQHPGYGWERNAGYGTREHLEALVRLGVTPHHRLSFAPVLQISRQSQAESV